MKTKELVKQVATFLQNGDILEADLDKFDGLGESLQKDINLIVSCLNETLSDIATEYINLTNTEKIEVKNGVFDTKNLSKKLHKAKKLGNNQKFSIVADTLFADDGTYDFVYDYLPDEVDLDGEFFDFVGLPKYAIAYSVCSEYCLILGSFSESEMWESRFENLMKSCTSNLKVFAPKNKRWL